MAYMNGRDQRVLSKFGIPGFTYSGLGVYPKTKNETKPSRTTIDDPINYKPKVTVGLSSANQVQPVRGAGLGGELEKLNPIIEPSLEGAEFTNAPTKKILEPLPTFEDTADKVIKKKKVVHESESSEESSGSDQEWANAIKFLKSMWTKKKTKKTKKRGSSSKEENVKTKKSRPSPKYYKGKSGKSEVHKGKGSQRLGPPKVKIDD